jgi:hypothetical protein
MASWGPASLRGMADERLRGAERRAARGDEPADLGRLVVERIRAGTISREALEVAAYLGHETAREALGEDGVAIRAPKTGIKGFVLHLPCEETFLPVLLGLLDRALPAKGPPAARTARDAVAGWLACPCKDHEAAGKAAASEAKRARGSARDPALELSEYLATAAGRGSEPRDLVALIATLEAALQAGGVDVAEARAIAGGAALRFCLARRGAAAEPTVPAAGGGLDVPRRLEPALAKAVLAALDVPGAKADRHKAVIRSYLEGRGWSANRHGNLSSPDGERRVKLKTRALELLERGSDGTFAKKGSTLGHQTLLSSVADEIVAAARRS